MKGPQHVQMLKSEKAAGFLFEIFIQEKIKGKKDLSLITSLNTSLISILKIYVFNLDHHLNVLAAILLFCS